MADAAGRWTRSPGWRSSRTWADRSWTAVAHTLSARSRSRPASASCARASPARGFYVILEGEVACASTGRATSRAWARATSSARSRSCSASRRSPTSSTLEPAAGAAPGRAGPARLPARAPAGDVPDAPVGEPPAGAAPTPADAASAIAAMSTSASSPGRTRRATTPSSSSAAGPGGLQASTTSRPHGHRPRRHLRRPGPGRHVPALPVLPAAAVVDQAVRRAGARLPRSTSATTGTACWPRSPSTGRVKADLMDGSSRSRRGRRWRRAWRASRSAPACASATARTGRAPSRDGDRFVLHTSDGDYRSRSRRSSRSASPSRYLPDTPGIEHVAHYVRHARRRAATPASGCSSSASRTPASSSPVGPAPVGQPHRPRLAARRPSCRSTRTRWRASGRATCSPGRTPTWAAACSS